MCENNKIKMLAITMYVIIQCGEIPNTDVQKIFAIFIELIKRTEGYKVKYKVHGREVITAMFF